MNKAWKLPACFGLLVGLVAVAPVLAITSGWIGAQLVTLAITAMLVLLPTAPNPDVQRTIVLFRPLILAASFPALWMLFQILPVPLGSIDHPIWQSAATALDEGLAGHISIDLGNTLRSLFGYLSLLSLTFISTIIARDRKRAETLLFALCTITTFIAVELILFRDSAILKPDGTSHGSADPLVGLAALGTILNAGFVIRAVERYETRGQTAPLPNQSYTVLISLGAIGAVICLFALISAASPDVLIATMLGLTLLGLVVVLRRLNLGRWSVAIVCAAVVVASAGIIALRFAQSPSSVPLFRFTMVESADAGAAILRMMSDANWVGGGVGSYQALAAIYRDNSGAPTPAALNTISSMVLEWGRGGLLIAVVLAGQLLLTLFRGALTRGRDSFFASSAAACVLTVFCEIYCDASFTFLTVQMFAAIVIGLGIAQTIGRRAA